MGRQPMEDAASAWGQMPLLRSEFLLQIVGELDDPQNVGETPLGVRRIFCMNGGSFSPRLAGEVLPGGGDWVLTRRDGVSQLDIRMTLRTDDKELIYVSCKGILDMAPEVRERILGGEIVDSAEYYFRTALVFETATEKHSWLNRLIAAGVGRRTAAGMVTDVFVIV
jgi:Protein of unknown function (DUF3237)